MTRPEIERVAKGLSERDREELVGCDPTRMVLSAHALMAWCLRELADVRREGSVFLTDDGLAVRRYLQEQQ